MNNIICIILIFFLLGLIVNHFKPLFEGMNCENDFEYDTKGEEGKLDEEQQKKYNELKAERKNIYKNKDCLRSLINSNSALVKAFKEDDFDEIENKYTTELKPSSKAFKESKREFNKSLDALYDVANNDGDDGVEGEAEEQDNETVGEIPDDAGASPNEDIGKPIDTEGAPV